VPLDLPNLDDRTAEQIKREMLLRIPRYLPNEWTDWNESDPGVILIELFAWLAESLAYRMNKAPELCLGTFLEVLGITPAPARPAAADLTFSVRRGTTQPISVPRFTQVGSNVRTSDGPIVFETEEGLDLIPFPLASVQVAGVAGDFETISTDAAPTTGFRPFGYDPQAGNALYLGFAPLDGAEFPPLVSLLVEPGLRPELSGQSPPRPYGVRLQWEYGDVAAGVWRSLSIDRDASESFSRRGYIRFGGPRVLTKPGPLGKEARTLHWIRCRLAAGAYQQMFEPFVESLRINTVRAASLTTVEDEFLGDSDSTTSQSFALRYRNVLSDTVSVSVTGADGVTEAWKQVRDLVTSGPRDPEFMVDAASGTVTFGEGTHGRIPTAGAEITANYRHGGAAIANVPKASITTLLSSLTGIDTVTNFRPAVGGADQQTIAELRKLAPSALRTRERALTAGDYRALALAVGGVVDATAIPLRHASYPEVDIPGCVTVAVAAGSQRQIGEASPDLLDEVKSALDAARPIGTELFVVGPRFVTVSVRVVVEVDPYGAFGEIRQAVKDRVDAVLGGAQPDQSRFGRDLYPSALYGAVQGVPGVRAVPSLVLIVDQVTHTDITQPVVVKADEIVVPAEDHDITVRAATDQ
jgi:phage-related baseplate assembly protein